MLVWCWALWSTHTLLRLGVSASDTDAYDYNESCHFLKLLLVSMCQCRVRCLCLWPCFIVLILISSLIIGMRLFLHVIELYRMSIYFYLLDILACLCLMLFYQYFLSCYVCLCLFLVTVYSGSSCDMEMYGVSETRNPDAYWVIFLK
jgi:hypothetical protein